MPPHAALASWTLQCARSTSLRGIPIRTWRAFAACRERRLPAATTESAAARSRSCRTGYEPPRRERAPIAAGSTPPDVGRNQPGSSPRPTRDGRPASVAAVLGERIGFPQEPRRPPPFSWDKANRDGSIQPPPLDSQAEDAPENLKMPVDRRHHESGFASLGDESGDGFWSDPVQWQAPKVGLAQHPDAPSVVGDRVRLLRELAADEGQEVGLGELRQRRHRAPFHDAHFALGKPRPAPSPPVTAPLTSNPSAMAAGAPCGCPAVIPPPPLFPSVPPIPLRRCRTPRRRPGPLFEE